MGLTDTGYVRRTYQDILDDKIQRAKELFGEDIETSELTPLGKFIRINAYDQAIAEEELEQIYYSRFPNTASGQSLDRLLVFTGLTRNPAEAACYSVKVTGTAGYTVPVGFLVGTNSVNFYNTAETKIGTDGTCTITVACTTPGTLGNVSASAINKVVNPDASITSVEGITCVTAGQEEESDAELRARFKLAVQGSGSCNENALRAALLRVPGVQYATVIANDSETEDSEGRPPHSFECYVLGGSGQQQKIAEAIFDKKPIGIKTTGDISVILSDASGNEKTVYYSNTETVSVFVKVNVKVENTYPDDGTDQIKSNVMSYINGLGIGKSVITSSIYGCIYSVTGVKEVTTLELSTNNGTSYSPQNVTVSSYAVAVCSGVTVEVQNA
ncbi:MAG: baseplate J/gp47 family protein [Oscillospiraceae bacterium]|jgi:uncharacterized phage protein gp47/JayE